MQEVLPCFLNTTQDGTVTDSHLIDSKGRVVFGCARFSYLGHNLARLEYEPDGRFENKPTLRALSMPEPCPFTAVVLKDSRIILRADEIVIRYIGPASFSSENCRITWQSGNLAGQWCPGQPDEQNLGAIISMDHINRDIIADGVHPAGVDSNDRLGEYNTVHSLLKSRDMIKADPSLYPNQRVSLGELCREYDALPEPLKKIAGMWKHLPPGPVSCSGYWTLDETGMYFYDPQSEWLVKEDRPNYQNIFFGAYGRDFYAALRQFTSLCGRIPLLPRWAFGPWHSRFFPYTDRQIQDTVKHYETSDLPLDVVIIDMDWHINGWAGWEWNTERFPDLDAFLAWKNKTGINVALNVHDEQIPRCDKYFKEICARLNVPESIDNPQNLAIIDEKDHWILDWSNRDVWEAMRDVCYTPNENRGIDFWWLDNWQGIQSGFNHVLWKNHLVFNHLAQSGRRPVILGRYAGIGSHRYPAFFSGDTASHWEVLKFQLEINSRAGNVGMVYFSHDLGGFKGHVPGHVLPYLDTELYIRWMQMGALSPVMRIHSDHGTREPWEYGQQAFEIVRKAYHLHVQLVPYMYHLAYEAYQNATPVHQPLYFLYPEDEKAFNYLDQYFLGSRMLCAPVVEPGGRRSVYLPPGTWYSLTDNTAITGPHVITRYYALDQIPIFVWAGSIIPMQNVGTRVGTDVPDPLVLSVFPGGDDSIELYEDDGSTQAYLSGSCSRWPLVLRCTDDEYTVILQPMKGSYDGMLTERNVEIKIHYSEKPKEVIVDSPDLNKHTWEFNAATSTITIMLPGIAVADEHTVRVVINH